MTDEVYGQLISSRQGARYRRYVEDVESDEAVQGFYRKIRTPPILASQEFVTRIIEDPLGLKVLARIRGKREGNPPFLMQIKSRISFSIVQ